MRRHLFSLLFTLAPFTTAPAPAAAQGTESARPASGATVTGTVVDSIAHAPLAGAIVQIAAADSFSRFAASVFSDSLGRFTLRDVPDGRYIIGFLHPMLDSLGLEPTLRQVVVSEHRPLVVDLAIPSAKRLRAAICTSRGSADSGAVLIGVVRDPRDGSPLANVAVSADWLEFSISATGTTRHVARRAATTRDNGWFAMCNVPAGGTVALSAGRGADSTDRIEVTVPTDGFLRRELYLGAPGARGLLSGTVRAAAGNAPLPGARVSIAGGPQVLTNEQGEWTLVNAPLGTHVLEVRALTYYPEHRPVDVINGAAPVRVSLATLTAVLDTVRVTAQRLGNRRQSGFEERRRTAYGQFLGPEDIARRNPIVLSDIFRNLAGVRVSRHGIDATSLLVRGAVSDWCSPAIYLNGQYLRSFTADDIDDSVRPGQVAGVEVYTGGSAPAQFQPGLSGCGSIVIWTK